MCLVQVELWYKHKLEDFEDLEWEGEKKISMSFILSACCNGNILGILS